MNIAELSRVDVNDDQGNTKHTVYLSKDNAGVFIVQAKHDHITDHEMHEAAEAMNKAVATAIMCGYSVIALGSNFEVKLVNLGDKNERIKEVSELLKSE
jgi:spermidine synthase